MKSELLYGRAVRDSLFAKAKSHCSLKDPTLPPPTLALLRVGEKKDDICYETALYRSLTALGMKVSSVVLKEDQAEEAKALIADWNSNSEIHGILPMMPLPENFAAVFSEIAPEKDVDGLLAEKSCFFPCTPRAVMELLAFYGIEVKGKAVAVLGRSALVGAPLKVLLSEAGAEVAVIHSKTEDPFVIAKNAEILCSAVGKPRLLDQRYLRKGQTVIDIGIHGDPLDRHGVCGDLDEKWGSKLGLRYTPVPGGIGEVTVGVLAQHMIAAWEKQR